MIQTHINTNNTDFTYTNTTDLGQNIFVTGTGGAGNINTSTYDSGHTRYYNKGAVGVALQIFVDDTLCESISGGEGNIVSVADIYKHVRTENHRRKYSCGFLGLKTCWRDNWVQIWEWGHNRRNATHRAEGQTKSFVLNIPPKSTLKVKFVGSSDSEFKGSVSISLLDNPLSIPFKPIDLSGLEGLVEKIPEPLPETPELPEVQEPLPEVEVPEVEPSPESPETELPEVDSSENAGNPDKNILPAPALSREQILAYQSFLGDFMEFFTQNQNQKITENMTFLDYYNANKSEANEPYESFLSSQLMANGGSIIMRDFLADFMQSTESELQEFFANMPQTQHKDGDLLDLSYFELIGLLGEQGGDSSQEPPIVEPESPQEQEPTISAEMRAEARKLTEAMQSYQTFLRENKDKIVSYYAGYNNVSYQFVIKKKYGGYPLDTFCDSKLLVDLPYVELWYGLPPTQGEIEQDMLDCGLIPYWELTFKNELQELNYPQLLEIANI
ncbi:Uncharacterised protein [Helicobacter cinaedi]|uniref:Uncharacterized protein n=1 Tax=Helicobacter cinaedi TaxID=213 RepID=A0A377JSV5_9HELI|nr:hypothetical protein [Helicobacter cinaedi]STP11018.1 Uncharacterised protein [Helicobacter cinaedi]STP14321.1 Uncharacterised protein [Helicobacter cinaedi]STP14336.1 Uncharacterised protein [Helicobacter cinaedi]